MLDQFILSVIAGAIFIWLPGILVLVALRFDRLTAISLSPVISLFIYWVVGEVYKRIGIFTDWLMILLPSVLIPLFAFIFTRMMLLRLPIPNTRRMGDIAGLNSKKPVAYAYLAIYLLFGIGATAILYISNLGATQDFLAEYDNIHHLGVVRSFVETGVWSSFNVGITSGIDDSIAALGSSSFYPTLWHTVAAFIVSLFNVPVTLAANATNYIFAALVFSTGMFFLLRTLFKNDRIAFLSGAFLSFAFIAFPWKYIIWGPLFPNLSSYALLPTVCSMFLYLFSTSITKKTRITAGIIVCIGLITLAVAQTNAVFTMAVFFIPFCIWQASRIPQYRGENTKKRRLMFAILAAIVIAVAWCAFILTPFMRPIVTQYWAPFTDIPHAIFNALTLSFRESEPQYLLGLVVVVGICASFVKNRIRWVVFSYLIMAFFYVFCASMDSSFEQVFGGFWYTDPMRLGASAAFYAIPIASLGLSFAARAVQSWVLRARNAKKREIPAKSDGADGAYPIAKPKAPIAAYAVATAVIILIFVPFGNLFFIDGYKPAFAYLADTFKQIYAPVDEKEATFDADTGEMTLTTKDNTRTDDVGRLYGLDEQRFVDKVKEITGDDLVINMPNDGSALAYPINGLNIYYRYASGYAGDGDSADSQTIRDRLKDISTDSSVREAVSDIDAKYVLKLDQGDQGIRNSVYLWSYDEDDWIGIDEIDDTTPGFETVLSEGDMRLYRIL